VVSDPQKVKTHPPHLALRKETGAARQLTFSEKSEALQDGRRRKKLAFLSNRGGDEQQIYVLSMTGGEAAAVTKGKASVSAFAWSPTGNPSPTSRPRQSEAERKKRSRIRTMRALWRKDDKQPAAHPGSGEKEAHASHPQPGKLRS